MKFKKISLIAICSLGLFACHNDPISTIQTDNNKIKIDKLFTHDGCTVYRFLDGNYIYWVHCPNSGDESTMWTTEESCGKSCVKTVYHSVITKE